jgi:N-methylhydantoinase B
MHGANVSDRIAGSKVPQAIEDLKGDRHELPWKTISYRLKAGDVVEAQFPTIAGYGDPLRRAPEAVLVDVQAKILDPATAERVYGVVITADQIDLDGTSNLRRTFRRERLGGKEPGEPVSPPDGAKPIGEILYLVDDRWWCNGADLGRGDCNYKSASVMIERPITAIGKEFETPFQDVATRVMFREFICPVTGYRIDTEIALGGQPPLHDTLIVCRP